MDLCARARSTLVKPIRNIANPQAQRNDGCWTQTDDNDEIVARIRSQVVVTAAATSYPSTHVTSTGGGRVVVTSRAEKKLMRKRVCWAQASARTKKGHPNCTATQKNAANSTTQTHMRMATMTEKRYTPKHNRVAQVDSSLFSSHCRKRVRPTKGLCTCLCVFYVELFCTSSYLSALANDSCLVCWQFDKHFIFHVKIHILRNRCNKVRWVIWSCLRLRDWDGMIDIVFSTFGIKHLQRTDTITIQTIIEFSRIAWLWRTLMFTNHNAIIITLSFFHTITRMSV